MIGDQINQLLTDARRRNASEILLKEFAKDEYRLPEPDAVTLTQHDLNVMNITGETAAQRLAKKQFEALPLEERKKVLAAKLNEPNPVTPAEPVYVKYYQEFASL